MWTIIRSLPGSLADLADAILIPHLPTDTVHQYKDGKGSSKKVWQLVTENPFLIHEKRRCRDG